MQSNNKIYISAAGSGKTTLIVDHALSNAGRRAAIVTYTQNNVSEIKKKFFEKKGFIPANVEVISWFRFLLGDFVRPYQNFMYKKRIESIAFVNGQSTRGIAKSNISKYYLYKGKKIYTDKISEFSCLCDEKSKGMVIERLAQIYDDIYIDEVQDLAGYDLEILLMLFNSKINITLVGDHRQATYSTNHSRKNKKYSGDKIINKFIEWEDSGLCSISYVHHSYRCNQAICDFSDSIYPDLPKTESKSTTVTGHDGVFFINSCEFEEYIEKYAPRVLRYDKRTRCPDCNCSPINFGDSKGLTFDRVLIFPNGPVGQLLSKGDFTKVSKSAAKFYVAVTRARYSVAFVYDGPCRCTCVDEYTCKL